MKRDSNLRPAFNPKLKLTITSFCHWEQDSFSLFFRVRHFVISKATNLKPDLITLVKLLRITALPWLSLGLLALFHLQSSEPVLSSLQVNFFNLFLMSLYFGDVFLYCCCYY